MTKNEYCCGRMEECSAVYVNDDLTEFYIYDEKDDRKSTLGSVLSAVQI